jgi:hypothetical protein
MSEKHDIYFRAHTVVIDKPKQPKSGTRRPRANVAKWPKHALVFDCESRTDTSQELTFGFYRVLKLNGKTYDLVEEGAFFDDDLLAHEHEVLESYVSTAVPDVTSFPPQFPLYSRSEFIKKVFYKMARNGAMIVGFNLCFDLARLARKWPEGDRDEWSLILSEHPDGNENLYHPRVLIEPIDSKKSFIRFWLEWIPKNGKVKPTKISDSRFLDLRTLLWALFNQALSLKRACELEAFKKHNLPQKIEHKPTGGVTIPEIKYARQDVRCTAALLNAAKQEFDLHPIRLNPDKAYSPASIAKAYLEAMGITTPAKKFAIPNEILGTAMESYTGGRSETRIRHAEVPVVPVDFTSEYPSTCALLELTEILTAESLTFEDATEEAQRLLNTISLDKCFNRKLWRQFRFFALFKPDKDILPVRTMYNGIAQNIGNNYLSSQKTVWVAGPDVINSVIQTGKVPHIERARRIVPHGKQTGMRPVYLRGTVKIDPYKDDLFRKVIEERKRHKSDKDLYYWLKIFANAIYGFFVEINPEPTPERNPVRVHVYSGEESFEPEERFQVAEKQGKWYAPYLASLITSGGRLLLGMLEKCVTDCNGVYSWADTDALAIVSSRHGGSLSHVPGCGNASVLPWKEVEAIVERFTDLNPYNFTGSILNLVDDNFVDSDSTRPRRQLSGFSISAKRYVLYDRIGNEINIINPKAHGLGYLYPPVDSPKDWNEEHNAPKWIYEFWECLLRIALGLKRNDPSWLKRPQMMRMAVTTQNVLKRLHHWKGFRPYNFFLLPILANCGYPANVDLKYFTPVAPFESDQQKWIESLCLNISDPNDKRKYKLTTDFNSPEYGKRAVVDTFANLLYRYLQHPEFKSLAPDGGPCKADTRGLLQRAHIIAGKHRRIGKESDRRWEEGDDFESLRRQPIEYEPKAMRVPAGNQSKASEALVRQIKKIGIRELIRFGCGRRTLAKICRRESVNDSTLHEYERVLREYKLKQKRAGARVTRLSPHNVLAGTDTY